MNLPKYPAKDPLPRLDDIQSLINQANSFETCEFNKEAAKLTGQWYKGVDDYIQSSGNLRQEVFLKLWQSDDNLIANRVLIKTNNLEITSKEEELTRIKATTITDIGMTSMGDDIGLVFVTGGDLSDDFNEAIFVPRLHTNSLKVSSHLYITNE